MVSGPAMVHYLLAFVFLVFGMLQYNDPDFYIWGPLYFITAILPLAYARGRFWSAGALIWTVILFLYLLSYLPDLVAWISGGMPTIAGSMQAEAPQIELTREFFGLALCLALAITYFYLNRKKQKL